MAKFNTHIAVVEGVPFQLTTGEWVVMYEFGVFPYRPLPEGGEMETKQGWVYVPYVSDAALDHSQEQK